jgi:putative exporter of polyketide antibiotics
MLAVTAGIGSVYPSQEARKIARLATQIGGVAQGVSGKPVNVDTLGGYVQWKYGPVFLFIMAIWSIQALSSTLAGEARRGSLEFVASSPFGKRRIAHEKVAAHLTVMTIVLAIMAFATWLAGSAFAVLPGDKISVQAAVGTPGSGAGACIRRAGLPSRSLSAVPRQPGLLAPSCSPGGS